MHRWDEIRLRPVEFGGIHESVFRAYAVAAHVKTMLRRGDSPETVLSFIEWTERRPSRPPAGEDDAA